ENAFALRNPDLPGGQDEERCARLALPDQRGAGCDAMPVRDVQDLPQVDIGEVAEELEASQRVELFRVRYRLLRCLQIVEHSHQGLRQLVPGLITCLEPLLQHLLDDVIDRRWDLGSEDGGRWRIYIDDLEHHAVIVRGLERETTGQKLIHNHTEGKDIGLVRKRLLLYLLWRHVGRRADSAHLRSFGGGGERRPEV